MRVRSERTPSAIDAEGEGGQGAQTRHVRWGKHEVVFLTSAGSHPTRESPPTGQRWCLGLVRGPTPGGERLHVLQFRDN